MSDLDPESEFSRDDPADLRPRLSDPIGRDAILSKAESARPVGARADRRLFVPIPVASNFS